MFFSLLGFVSFELFAFVRKKARGGENGQKKNICVLKILVGWGRKNFMKKLKKSGEKFWSVWEICVPLQAKKFSKTGNFFRVEREKVSRFGKLFLEGKKAN